MNTTEKSNKKSITKTITSRIYLAMSIYPVIWPIKFAKIVKIITNGALLELHRCISETKHRTWSRPISRKLSFFTDYLNENVYIKFTGCLMNIV